MTVTPLSFGNISDVQSVQNPGIPPDSNLGNPGHPQGKKAGEVCTEVVLQLDFLSRSPKIDRARTGVVWAQQKTG